MRILKTVPILEAPNYHFYPVYPIYLSFRVSTLSPTTSAFNWLYCAMLSRMLQSSLVQTWVKARWKE